MRAIDMNFPLPPGDGIDRDFCGCVICEAQNGWPTDTGDDEMETTFCGGGQWYGTRKWHPHGQGSAFLGAELELCNADREAWQAAYGHLGDVVAEAKPDGALLEITSHPMTLPSFMRLYPWEMLGELRAAGATANPSYGGLHIHIAKTAFDSADHIFNWWRLYYANPSQTNRLGGRAHVRGTSPPLSAMRQLAENQAGQAAFLRAAHAAARNAITKGGRLCLRPEDRAAVTAARRKTGNRWDHPNGEHYDVIATQRHRDTFECRFPGATLDPATMKARLQFIHAGMEYARQLPSTDSAGHAFSQFAAWVQQRGRYPELRQAIQAL